MLSNFVRSSAYPGRPVTPVNAAKQHDINTLPGYDTGFNKYV